VNPKSEISPIFLLLKTKMVIIMAIIVGEGFIPSRKGSPENQYRLQSKILVIQGVTVFPAVGDKPHPYRLHLVADTDIIDSLF
jgi:hypothetical protein